MKNFALVMVGFAAGAFWGWYKTMEAGCKNQKIRKAIVEETADWIVSKLNL